MERIIEKMAPGVKHSKLARASFEFAIYKQRTVFVEGETDKRIYQIAKKEETNCAKFIVAGNKKNAIALARMHSNTGNAFAIVDNDCEEISIEPNVIDTNRINLEAEMLCLDDITELQMETYFELFKLLNSSFYLIYEHDALSQLKKPNPIWKNKIHDIILKSKSIEELVENKIFRIKKSNYKELLEGYDDSSIYASKYILAVLMKEKYKTNEVNEIYYFLDHLERSGVEKVIEKMNSIIKEFNKHP